MENLNWGGTGALKNCAYVSPKVGYDFLYSTSTYSGILISSKERLIKEETNLIERLEEKMKDLNHNGPYKVFKSYQKDYPEILQTRVIMAQFTSNDCKTLGAIWFDDGVQDLVDSMKEVFKKLDWNNAEEFEY
jgi:hypothetical protein